MLSLKKSVTIKIVKMKFFRRILIFIDLNCVKKKNEMKNYVFIIVVFTINIDSF